MRPLIALALLVLAACGSSDRQGAVGGAPLLTPAEAEGRDGLVAVQGFLWARPGDGVFRLCEASLESFPPQCGEPAVDLTGVDLTEIAGIDFSQNVFWAEQVRARGELAAERLVVEAIELNSKDPATGLSYRLIMPVEVSPGSTGFVALLTNSSVVPVELRFSSGQSADVILTDPATATVVYRWSDGRSFDQAIRDLTLQPGETARYVLDGEDLDLAAGAYDLESRLTASPAPGVARGRAVVR